MRALGQSYSRTLRTSPDQVVIQSGPYRFIRHPGYLGSLLIWTGFGLTSGSVPVIGLVAGLLGPAYRFRISAEEKLLRQGCRATSSTATGPRSSSPRIW